MSNVQFDSSYLMPILVLLLYGFVSAILSLAFHLKYRDIKRLRRNLSATSFDKTFKVLNPNPDPAKITHSQVLIVTGIILIIEAYFWSIFVISWIFQAGLVLAIVVFLVCFSFMITDEAMETYNDAKTLVKAVRERADLGKGDLETLFQVKRVLPRLSLYYSLLAITFFASSTMLPYIVSSVLQGLAGFFGVVLDLTTFTGAIVPFVALIPFVVVALASYAIAKRVKEKVMRLPSKKQ